VAIILMSSTLRREALRQVASVFPRPTPLGTPPVRRMSRGVRSQGEPVGARTSYVRVIYTSLKAPYAVTNDSSRQNTNEYLGIMLLIKQTQSIAPGFAFNVEGHNTTYLKWCASDRVSSVLARRADIGFSILAVDLYASVAEVTHIPGVDNVVYDGLLRGKGGLEVGLPADKFVLLNPDTIAYQYMCLCNPDLSLTTIKQHTSLSSSFLARLSGGGSMDVRYCLNRVIFHQPTQQSVRTCNTHTPF
jgi:hypothetical protein